MIERAGPLPRRVPRRRLRLDHVPRRDRRADRADPAARSGRPAGRPAWRVKPGTPLSALEPYRELLDIVLVMTVEPGFGGQSFMKDVAEREAARRARPAQPQGVRRRGPRRRRDQPRDGRVRRRRSGSTSSSSGRRCSSRATTWAARSGSSGRSPTRATSTRLNDGVPPIPRDRMVTLHVAAEAPRQAVHGRDRGRRRAGRHAARRRPDEPRRRPRLRPARAGDGRGARRASGTPRPRDAATSATPRPGGRRSSPSTASSRRPSHP